MLLLPRGIIDKKKVQNVKKEAVKEYRGVSGVYRDRPPPTPMRRNLRIRPASSRSCIMVKDIRAGFYVNDWCFEILSF